MLPHILPKLILIQNSRQYYLQLPLLEDRGCFRFSITFLIPVSDVLLCSSLNISSVIPLRRSVETKHLNIESHAYVPLLHYCLPPLNSSADLDLVRSVPAHETQGGGTRLFISPP